jgi:hypothetical protein
MKYFLIFLCLSFNAQFLYAKVDTLDRDYKKFASFFQNKKFTEAVKYLAKEDKEVFEEIAQLNSESNIDNVFLEKELETMWELNYDTTTKINKIRELDISRNNDISQMQETLNIMKKNKSSGSDISVLEKSINDIKRNVDKEMLFVSAKTNAFGLILDRKMIGNYAILLCEAKYVFTSDKINAVRNLILVKDDFTESSYKFVRFENNVLVLPVLYVFSKENEKWKIMLFSREKFPNETFNDFLNKYEKVPEDIEDVDKNFLEGSE